MCFDRALLFTFLSVELAVEDCFYHGGAVVCNKARRKHCLTGAIMRKVPSLNLGTHLKAEEDIEARYGVKSCTDAWLSSRE